MDRIFKYDKLLESLEFGRLEPYINNLTKIDHKCLKCGEVKNITPKRLKKYICKCKREIKYKPENYTLLEPYKGMGVSILHKCNICGYISKRRPSRCSNKCKGCETIRYSNEHIEFLKSTDIDMIGEYLGSKVKTLHKCNICGNKFNQRPNDIKYGVRCPFCNISKGEETIRRWLDNNDIKYIREYILFDNYRYDFYLTNLNICIEYDGIQHYKPIKRFGGEEYFEKVKINDELKNKYCEYNDIDLLRISYKDFKNIDKILTEYLL